MLQQLKIFLIRTIVNAVVLYFTALVGLISYGDKFRYLFVAAVLLAILNAIIKPLLVIFTLPAIILTLGLFTILINGFIVVLVSWLFDKFDVGSFWSAMLVGLLVGLVNYLVTFIIGRIGKTNE